jgi:hypothetical protein
MPLRRRVLAAFAVVVAAVAIQLPSAFQPLGGDDVYILENLRSASWSRRLFAFNLDPPSPNYFEWWTGNIVQRRFIRVPASALLWIESELFGLHAIPYHLVTLALVAATSLLFFHLLSRRVPIVTAMLASVAPALHPASSEIVSSLACQPLATAGLFSLSAVVGWQRMRVRPSSGAVAVVVLLSALAVTSYEAAVVLPAALVLADVWLPVPNGPNSRRWAPRLAVLAVVVAYLPCAFAIRRGLTAPDTTPVRPLREVMLALRYDTVEYICKASGLLNPADARAYWYHAWAGEAVAVATAVGLLAATVGLVRRSRLGILGVVAFALFLAPPLLTRATVSALNFPSLRQLYLPMMLGAPPVLVALIRTRFSRVTIPLWCAVLALESVIAAGIVDADRARREVTESTTRILDNVAAGSTVVGVGDSACDFALSLVWPGPSLLGIPGYADDPGPQLTAVDDRTLIARTALGFDVRTEAALPYRKLGANRGPAWLPSQPTELATSGSQRISGATITVEAREGEQITALRYRFDRPLAEMAFVRFRDCGKPERMRVQGVR